MKEPVARAWEAYVWERKGTPRHFAPQQRAFEAGYESGRADAWESFKLILEHMPNPVEGSATNEQAH